MPVGRSRPGLGICESEHPDGVRRRLCENSSFVIVIDGIYYAAALAGAGVLVRWLAGPWFAAPLWLLAAFCLYFFRDPDRAIPAGPVAVSPADGKVVAVKPEGPALNRVSIFLNIFDVHVNRAPIAGAIADVEYQQGPVPRGQPRGVLHRKRAEHRHRRGRRHHAWFSSRSPA